MGSSGKLMLPSVASDQK